MGVRSARRRVPIAAAVSRVLRVLPILAPAALLDARLAMADAPAVPATLAVDIPAQPLADALATFARETGLQLVYVSGLAGKLKSRSAGAGLKVDAALTRLLQGSGLRFEYLTPDTVRIFVPPPPRASEDAIGEVIVTANRREQNQQDVPITVEVLTQGTLSRLNATTLDDFARYLPGITVHGVGPGQNNIYVRGLGTTDSGIQGASLGTLPNVALYLDEQSVQLPGRNLDVYAADLERIEVLEGPQGTLFGAGAEAGVVRYITNKPQLDVTEANLNAGYALTAHGGPSAALDATL